MRGIDNFLKESKILSYWQFDNLRRIKSNGGFRVRGVPLLESLTQRMAYGAVIGGCGTRRSGVQPVTGKHTKETPKAAYPWPDTAYGAVTEYG
jgi:hypothetical protein